MPKSNKRTIKVERVQLGVRMEKTPCQGAESNGRIS